MSDEHAPLRLLRQVFGDDIVEVYRDWPAHAACRTARHGDVMVTDGGVNGSLAAVGDLQNGDNSMRHALRGAIVCRAGRARADARRLSREADLLDALRVSVPE